MEPISLFGIELINTLSLLELLIRFAFNFLVSLILIRYIYYRNTRREQYVFSFLLISSTIFLLIFLLTGIKMKLGFALGLLAIFGIIRYRTNPIPIKEMTYLFATIALSVINAMANKKVSYAELVLSNLLILGLVYAVERFWLTSQLARKKINYEKIELIRPDKRSELLKDLKERTGLEIVRLEIGAVNFLNDTAKILIYYKPQASTNYLEEDFLTEEEDD